MTLESLYLLSNFFKLQITFRFGLGNISSFLFKWKSEFLFQYHVLQSSVWEKELIPHKSCWHKGRVYYTRRFTSLAVWFFGLIHVSEAKHRSPRWKPSPKWSVLLTQVQAHWAPGRCESKRVWSQVSLHISHAAALRAFTHEQGDALAVLAWIQIIIPLSCHELHPNTLKSELLSKWIIGRQPWWYC